MSNESGFVAGTLVHTDKGLVPIQNLKVGDFVLSRAENDQSGKLLHRCVKGIIFSENNDLRLIRLIRHYSESSKDVYGIIATSSQHFLLENSQWVCSKYLETGSTIRIDSGTIIVADQGKLLSTDNNNIAWVPNFPLIFPNYEDGFIIDLYHRKINSDLSNMITTVKRKTVTEKFLFGTDEENAFISTVYNIEVEETQTYFVGEQGVWVHQ